jgi:DNA topoisomerase IB
MAAKNGIRAKPSAETRSAKSAGLVYVSDTQPGIRRRRAGKGFSYLDANGNTLRESATLARIRALAIPPAYSDVWICRDPRGHIQATGRDARGRKQYRYHTQWRTERDSGKFDRLLAFADALPALRRRVRHDLALPGLPREKVLATVIGLLAQTLIRIGNAEYARDNHSFGLTTLRDRHVEFLAGGRARLAFRGKSGLEHEITVDDSRLVQLVRRCQQLPGQQLFQYLDDEGRRQPVDSTLVNDYLRGTMGAEFTAKDFRTWAGTLAALTVLAQMPLPEKPAKKSAAERLLVQHENAAVKEVATLLGNTPAVCRKSYIHPEVFAAWREGVLADALPDRPMQAMRKLETQAVALLRRRLKGGRKPK